MKKNKLVKGLIISVATASLLLTTVFASTAGSSDDPIVTKSYVDSQVASLMEIISSSNSGNSGSSTGSLSDADKEKLVEEVTKQVVAIINAQGGSGSGTTTDTTAQSYVPVELQSGQILFGGEGTEIILRSGVAQAYVTTANGIVNATTGQDLTNGQTINKNNILIVPREDGRGIRAVSDSTWVLVKGSYTIQ